VARKQAGGKQISRIALAARCFAAAAVIIAAARPSPVFALPDSAGAGKRQSAPVKKSAAKQKAAPPPQKARGSAAQAPKDERAAKNAAPQKQTPPPSHAVSAVESEISKTMGTLDSVKAQLERGRARSKELRREEGNYLSRIEQIERNISASGKYAELVQRRIDTTEALLIALGDSLTKAETDLYKARELMKKRLRGAQQTGGVGRLQMLLTARSASELVHRVRYFQDLNRYDRRLAAEIREGIASVGEKRKQEGENRGKLLKLLSDKRREQEELSAEEAQRRAMLSDIRTKKSAHDAMVAELEEAQNELDALIKTLEGRRRKVKEEEERKAAVSFENRKGKLPWPLRGEVVRKFGNVVHPVYKTITPNNGIDIAAKKGAPVKNAAPGDVALVKWMRGYGRCVFIDHGGGFYTLYAHLDEVSVTENSYVPSDTEIGKAGETGTTGGPKLHFEIKQRAESLNPEDWLEK
jgi:septal ring factor EnvC (AmiA/AmiB activator)